jgi:hypothetical protein
VVEVVDDVDVDVDVEVELDVELELELEVSPATAMEPAGLPASARSPPRIAMVRNATNQARRRLVGPVRFIMPDLPPKGLCGSDGCRRRAAAWLPTPSAESSRISWCSW